MNLKFSMWNSNSWEKIILLILIYLCLYLVHKTQKVQLTQYCFQMGLLKIPSSYCRHIWVKGRSSMCESQSFMFSQGWLKWIDVFPRLSIHIKFEQIIIIIIIIIVVVIIIIVYNFKQKIWAVFFTALLHLYILQRPTVWEKFSLTFYHRLKLS